MLRRLFLSTPLWLWMVLSGSLLAGHGLWAWSCRTGLPMQRVGAPLIVIGIIVAARPFIRDGFATAIQKALPSVGMFPLPAGESHRVREAARPEAKRDIRANQVYGPILVLLGTILSGYGDIFADVTIKLIGAYQ